MRSESKHIRQEIEEKFDYYIRLQMDANGESMGRRWQKGIHVQGPIIVAQ